jgi:Ca-activated chloride channel family protein
MKGSRIASLKDAMRLLASNASVSSQRYARFQKREEIGIITFNSEPAPTRLFSLGSTQEESARARSDITQFINSLESGGGTAIYTSLQRALVELAREQSQSHEKRYYTVVLMTDGESNQGLDAAAFRTWYMSQGEQVRGIRVFPILFGEGNQRQLNAIADMTGGRLFDSNTRALAAVFKEIRGYQ